VARINLDRKAQVKAPSPGLSARPLPLRER
jgi:hypothetical protein